MLNSLRLPATFRAFSHRNYLLWFVGQGISLIGTWMQTMAQQVLLYRLTGSAASLGLISFIGLIPIIPLSLWGGSITDRFPKRTILVVTQSVMLVQAFLLAGLTWSGTGQIWHVYVLAFVCGAVILSLLMMRGLPKPKPVAESDAKPIKHMAGGLQFILQRQTILVLVSLIAVSAFLSMPYNTLLPVFASEVSKRSALPVVGALCNSY